MRKRKNDTLAKPGDLKRHKFFSNPEPQAEEKSEGPNLIHLRNITNEKMIYQNLREVEQDSSFTFRTSTEDKIDGLTSQYFSVCYAVIIQSISTPKIIALAHLSSIHNVDLIQGMIDDVTEHEDDFEICIARSLTQYQIQYELEDDLEDPTTFFRTKDRQAQQFFKDNFGIDAPIDNMPHGLLVIDRKGVIDFCEEYDSLDLEFSKSSTETPLTPSP